MTNKIKIILYVLLSVGFCSLGNAQQKQAIAGPYLYHFTGGDSEFKDQDDMDTLGDVTDYTFDRIELMAPLFSTESGKRVVATIGYHNEKFNFEKNSVDSKSASLGALLISGGNVFLLKNWSHPDFENKSVYEGVFLTDIDIDWFDGFGYDKVSSKILFRALNYPSWTDGLIQLRSTLSDNDGSYLQFFISTKGPARFVFGSYDGQRVIQYGYRADETRGQADDSTVWNHVSLIDFFGSYSGKIKGPLFWSIEGGMQAQLRRVRDEDGSGLVKLYKTPSPYITLKLETWIEPGQK